ncbi:MAG TPA: DNA methylase, partial [Clostridiaceae bacterium]|nr:DNA methylase [Clostridiaceae bacterium]
YTACPNPFIEEFIKENGTPYDEATDDYHCEPFAADVSEGKNDPIYMAHAYHTKVPHKAIMRYILHYTKPGDIVFDGFCGTGMTGVAAQMCGMVDDAFKLQLKNEVGTDIQFGARNAILNDLAPAATFISSNYNTSTDVSELKDAFDAALEATEKEYGWLYETNHSQDNQAVTSFFGTKGKINFIVWSDVFICSNCGKEVIFWDEAVDLERSKIDSKFRCPQCRAELGKSNCERAVKVTFDTSLGQNVTMSKQVPVLINYTYMGKRYSKKPDPEDLMLIEKINNMEIHFLHPVCMLPDGYNTEQPKRSNGIYYVHQLYTKRNLLYLSKFFSLLYENKLKFIFTSVLQNASKMYKYRTDGKGGIVTGTLYIPALSQENNVYNLLSNKAEMIYKACLKYSGENCIISTNSSTQENIPDSSIDYIFTDPPFGANINYSELSFLWEAWLKVITETTTEAICNSVQGKGLAEYQNLMTRCFMEFYRILKPNHWMTVEFHNSKNTIWNSIQEGLQRAGFIIADVRTLDKKQGSFKQVTTSSAVKQDLVISAYKPKDSFKNDIFTNAGTEETAWKFVRQHLENIPVVVVKNEKIEPVAERQAFLLFDRMVAYHIMQGIPVPIDATDFYRGLDEKFLKRDGMYFLADQVNEYDTARIKNDIEPIQFSLFVTNEKTAISWLYQQLDEPQTYAEIQPKFMQEVKSVDKFEAMPELAILLEENFLQDEKGCWYIPDTTKEGDVAKLREKKLWKEFEGYMNSKGKLKLFRSEAIRVGFSRLWKDKNYQAIVDIAERLPEKTIQEDPNLLMYYDISLSRV